MEIALWILSPLTVVLLLAVLLLVPQLAKTADQLVGARQDLYFASVARDRARIDRDSARAELIREVGSTHRNWEEKYQALQGELRAVQSQLDARDRRDRELDKARSEMAEMARDDAAQHHQAIRDFQVEATTLRSDLAKATSERDLWKKRCNQLADAYRDSMKVVRDALLASEVDEDEPTTTEQDRDDREDIERLQEWASKSSDVIAKARVLRELNQANGDTLDGKARNAGFKNPDQFAAAARDFLRDLAGQGSDPAFKPSDYDNED